MTNHKKRMCLVAPEFIGPFPNGGVGTACYWEALALGEAGFDVTVLYTGPNDRETPEYWQSYFAAHAPFRYVDLARWSSENGADAQVAAYDVPCVEARQSELVLAYLRVHEFDLVLLQEFLGHAARALQARRSGYALANTRAAVTMHSCRQWIYQGMHRLPTSSLDVAVDFLERESARLADRVVAPSAHMAEWGATHWKLDGSAAVIPYCYDAAAARPRQVIEHNGPFRHLVFFGRLETRKGLHLFCRALAKSPAVRETVRQVTFLGKHSSVEGLPSEEFIAAAMAQVPGIEFDARTNLGSLEALAWLKSQSNILVVSPSLVDNLPYALIELYSHRIPFLSTDIGGIPEIVGESNRHALAPATEAGVAALIDRVCRNRKLVIDYRDGYDVSVANRTHVEFVAGLLKEPTRSAAVRDNSFSIVVTDACELTDVRARFEGADPDTIGARWCTFEDWRRTAGTTAAIFVDSRIEPERGLIAALLAALTQPGVDAATTYYRREGREPGSGLQVATPLGSSLESGWSQNCFGGPCFAANPAAFPHIADAIERGPFACWPAYAAIACSDLLLAMIPAALYFAPPESIGASSFEDLEAVIRQYHTHTPAALDLGWLLRIAFTSSQGSASVSTGGGSETGRALYSRFLAIPDRELSAYADLNPSERDDPYIRGFEQVRTRLAERLARWRLTSPRVFIYGAGQHTRMLLTVVPELGSFVAGFIDRRPIAAFLGKRCVSPEAFDSAQADVIVYSSREFEREMCVAMSTTRVEHVLLYNDSPAPPADTTATRLQNRFGHPAPDLKPMHELYKPPAWATGYISRHDADFLAEMIAAHAPHTVVELGVASGASSAVILQALDRLPDINGGRVLHSCDIRPTCYFDDTHATGEAARAMYPDPRTKWHLHTDMDARRIAAALTPASVDLTFIDANHAHPWPLLDLLHVAALAKPHSWIVLHDIDLPLHYPEHQTFGPRWLFELWPFNKVKGFGKWTSIGAIQLPADPVQLVAMALTLIERPWEHAPAAVDIVLPAVFSEVEERLRLRLAVSPELIAQD